MTKQRYPTNLIKLSRDLAGGWSHITPTPALGSLTPETFLTEVTAATDIDSQIRTLEAQLREKRNLRDAQYVALWDKMKRVRSLIKAAFGDDSTQYQLVGGTRRSDRKPYRRRTTP